MDAFAACWLAAAMLMALAALGGFVWVIRSSRRKPSSFDGYVFALCVMLGIAALIALAAGLGRVGGPWAAAGIVAVNLLLQPFCLYLFAASAYKFAMGLAGRAVYAWRVVPGGQVQGRDYQALRWYSVSQGMLGCLLALALSWSCLSLLW